eukprot:scaffold45397_cov65-Phaeocystis_antarctica.AAC.2
MTDLVTSAPLELLLLAAEDKARAASLLPSVERLRLATDQSSARGVQPQSAPRESSLGKPDVSIQRETGNRPARYVTRWRGQNAIVRRAAPTKRPRAEKRAVWGSAWVYSVVGSGEHRPSPSISSTFLLEFVARQAIEVSLSQS